MQSIGHQPLTEWLRGWIGGDEEAGQRALATLYDELRRIAGRLARGERRNTPLEATEVVHEAYLRLADLERVRWKSRTHFLAAAARMMRRVLVDQGRERAALKRGGDRIRITLHAVDGLAASPPMDAARVDEAVSRLAAFAPDDARVVELMVFGGLTQEETGEFLGVSRKTVGRRWRKARAWLYGELMEGDDGS